MKTLSIIIASLSILLLAGCVPESNKKCNENQVLVNGSCVLKSPQVVDAGQNLNCGNTPNNGVEARIAYNTSSAPIGQSCVSQNQTRTCVNGVWSAWSGSYQYLTCSVQAALACGTIASGAFELRTMYQVAAVSEGQICVSEIQNRQCTNGQFSNWSGTYTHPKCVVSRVRFESAIVQNTAVCNPETQTMTCENAICGVWTPNNYTFATCLLQTTPPATISGSPSISTVSGTINNGEILTITGTGFGLHADHNTTKDYLVAGWENFETGSADSIFKSNYGPELVTNTNLQKANSKYAAKGYYWETARTYTNVFGQTKNTNKMYGFHLPLATYEKKIFISGWYMFPEGFDIGINYDQSVTDQTKFLCLTPIGVPNDMGGDGAKTHFATRRGAVTNPLMTNTEDGHLAEGTTDPLFNYSPMGTWHRFDIYADLTKSEGQKIHNWYVDGKKLPRVHGFYNIDAKLTSSGAINGFNYLSWLMYQFQGDDVYTWFQYMDDAYADLTQARIEISESPVWDENKQTHKEIQIPLSWTDTKITIKTNLGAFNNNQELYLYVITDDGAVSTAKKISNAH